MGKVIFRKIAGRLVPIRIGSVKDILHPPGVVGRKITATIHDIDKTRVATMHLIMRKKDVTADIVNVAVEKKFQGHGISRALFKHAQELLGRAGKKFIRGYELQHVAQVKIRMKAGFPGPRGKSGSRFIGHGLGKQWDQSKRVSGKQAMEIIKRSKLPGWEHAQTVSATTMIPKKLRRNMFPRKK